MSTKSGMSFRAPSYQSDAMEVRIRETFGVDLASLGPDLGLSPNCITAYQRRLGLRKLTGNGVKGNPL